ncbi:MAG: nucleoside deaminase [Alphaproteobacteria bacterium]|nr:nucleoside deaminase [Alphaproteobacteria bacterium]
MNKKFLDMAIAESEKSVKLGSSPFGAVIVRNDVVVARAHNTVVLKKDPTAHAEVNAIRLACKKLGTFDLSGCDLYASCEPCPMCASASTWANISHVYYAADRKDADKIGFRDDCMFNNKCRVPVKHIENTSAVDTMNRWHKLKSRKKY